MPRGPKRHMKRLVAPKTWSLTKMGGVFAVRPTPGPHKLRECFPLIYLVKNRLKLAETAREAKMIAKSGAIVVNGKPRTDHRFPLGLMDVVHIRPKNQTFRLLYNANGRFCLAPMRYNEAAEERRAQAAKAKSERQAASATQAGEAKSKEKAQPPAEKSKNASKVVLSENKFSSLSSPSTQPDSERQLREMTAALQAGQKKKAGAKTTAGKIADPHQPKFTESRREIYVPCRVAKIWRGHKKAVGTNPAASGSWKQIPWLTTSCGRIFRYIDSNNVQQDDTIIVKIVSYRQAFPGGIVQYKTREEILEVIHFEEGKIGMATKGHNIGRVGRISEIEKHSLISDVVHLIDENNRKFVTKKENIFVIGNEKPYIGLAKDRGVRKTLLEKVQEQLK